MDAPNTPRDAGETQPRQQDPALELEALERRVLETADMMDDLARRLAGASNKDWSGIAGHVLNCLRETAFSARVGVDRARRARRRATRPTAEKPEGETRE